MRPAPIGVAKIAGKGRGIVALAYCEPGQMLEIAPAVELDFAGDDAAAQTMLDDYHFAHPADPEGGLLVFGHSSLCNHSDTPNAETTSREDPERGWIVELRALRPIAPGEEITRRYACELWFDPAP